MIWSALVYLMLLAIAGPASGSCPLNQLSGCSAPKESSLPVDGESCAVCFPFDGCIHVNSHYDIPNGVLPLSANMLETPTPWKFSVEGDPGVQHVDDDGGLPVAQETEVTAKAARRQFSATEKLRVLREADVCS